MFCFVVDVVSTSVGYAFIIYIFGVQAGRQTIREKSSVNAIAYYMRHLSLSDLTCVFACRYSQHTLHDKVPLGVHDDDDDDGGNYDFIKFYIFSFFF